MIYHIFCGIITPRILTFSHDTPLLDRSLDWSITVSPLISRYLQAQVIVVAPGAGALGHHIPATRFPIKF
jgi:hypothetical protein